MKFQIPAPLANEHQALRPFLLVASKEAGALGAAAQRLERLLQPHMHKEENFALPPLGLLADIARGRLDPEMAEVFAYTDWLKEHVADMRAEHRMLAAALEEVAHAARNAGALECVQYAEKLTSHMRLEEEVLYPAAILVGEYLALKLGRKTAERTQGPGNSALYDSVERHLE